MRTRKRWVLLGTLLALMLMSTAAGTSAQTKRDGLVLWKQECSKRFGELRIYQSDLTLVVECLAID